MSLQVILKNSSLSGKEPTAAQLANGEIALNYHADGPFLTCKDTAGVVRRIGGVWINATAPGSPTPGEFWLDISVTPAQLKVYKDGTDAWVAVITVYPASTTTAGVVELATNAETQTGTDVLRAVTPASLQSKVSDSTSTTSSTTIASSTAVKTAKDVADAALPKAGGTMTGQILADDSTSPTTPGYAFDGDPNTGVLRTGADALALVTGGTARLTISDTGLVVIPGDLTVNGTTTTINTEDLIVKDKNIQLASVETPTDTTADGGGVTVKGATDKTFNWVNATDSFTSSENLDLASGKTYKINGTDVLSATALGSAVQISSDNIPAGTVTNDDLAGSIADSKLNTISTAGKVSNSATTATSANTASAIVARDASGNFSAGTISAASFIPTSSTVPANGVYLPAANSVALSTNGTGRLFIDSSGRVGIGTASPTVSLQIDDPADARITVNDTGSGSSIQIRSDGTSSYIGTTSAHDLRLVSHNSERARIDSSGRLLVGTSSTSGNVAGNDKLAVVITGNNTQGGISVTDYAGSSFTVGSYAALRLQRSLGTTDGSFTALTGSSWGLGRIEFNGSNGVGFGTGATIEGFCDNLAWGSGDHPGRLVFSTTADGASSPTERLRITSAGNVGIGTTNPLLPFVISNGGAQGIELNGYSGLGAPLLQYYDRNASAWLDVIHRANGHRFNGPSSEWARIDSSGRLLVGTSAARAFAFGITPLQQIESATGSNGLSITTNRNDASSSILHFGKSRSAALGGFGIALSDDSVGSIRFEAADGTQLVRAAEIRVDVDGTPGVNDMPGRIVLSTTPDGSASPVERMSIGNAGAIFIGSTARTQSGFIRGASDGLKSYAASTTGTCRIECFHGGSTTVYHQVFSNSNGIVGSIATAASATSYNTSSDYRLKENIVPVTDGITRLQQLKPSRFNFIADPTKTVDGFLAHEVQTIVPEAITGEKDAVDDEGNPQYQGIDQSKLVPLLTAALQEAVAKIESLEARLTAAGI